MINQPIYDTLVTVKINADHSLFCCPTIKRLTFLCFSHHRYSFGQFSGSCQRG